MAEPTDRLPQIRAAILELEQAIARLDHALAGRKDEVELARELKAARADYDRLAAAARTVEARLDGVGDRLKAVLGG